VADELEAIRQLKARYCRFLDAKDADGIPEYRRRCDEIAAAGYTGFTLA
jgi:hypothetical protein